MARVNINAAGPAELVELGLDRAQAESLYRARRERQGFKSWDEVADTGIPRHLLDTLRARAALAEEEGEENVDGLDGDVSGEAAVKRLLADKTRP
jgi:hypothetical protein